MDAVRAVVDCFAGQPNKIGNEYQIDQGNSNEVQQIINLESVRIALEGAAMTRDVFKSMNDGAKALSNGLPNNGNLDDMMCDTEEALEHANDIADALSTKFTLGPVIDPDDLEDELNQMLIDTDEEKIEHTFPIVPNTKFPTINKPPSPNNEMEQLIAFTN